MKMLEEKTLRDRVKKYELSLSSELERAIVNIDGMLSMWGDSLLDGTEDSDLDALDEVVLKLEGKGGYQKEIDTINSFSQTIREDYFPVWNEADSEFQFRLSEYDKQPEGTDLEDYMKDLEEKSPYNALRPQINAIKEIVKKLKEEEGELPTLTLSLSGSKHNEEFVIRGSEKGMYKLYELLEGKLTNFFEGLNSLGTEDYPEEEIKEEELPFK